MPGEVLKRLQACEGLAILLVRVSIGFFFCYTGGSHLFIASQRQILLETLQQAGVPFPELNVFIVAGVEFVFGGLLALGLLTPIAALLLCGNMMVAIATDRIHTLQGKQGLVWLDDFLYLPEVLYVLILIWLIFSGPGKASMDSIMARRLGIEGWP